MSPEPRLRVGYVVKRFPRTSETFIAQEILELERQGVDVCVFPLSDNDQPAQHAWLGSLRAEVVRCETMSSSEAWSRLHARVSCGDSRAGRGARQALAWSLDSAKGRRDLAQSIVLARMAGERGIDHLHAHFANRPAMVSLLTHALTGLPFSLTAHAKDVFAQGPSRATWRRLARRSEFIVTVAESNRRHIGELLGDRLRDRVRVLYNGVDLAAITPQPQRQRAPHAALRLLCVARLVPKKGLTDLLHAAALLRERGLPFRCSIVGDGPERESLEKLRDERGLSDCVQFEGAFGHERVIECLSESDAVILPCRVTEDGDRDVLPTVLLEAMAAGIPCVSTSVGGIPEIVEPGETGLLVPERDPDALAHALYTLAADPPLARRMGAAGRRRAERLFDRRRSVGVLRSWFAA